MLGIQKRDLPADSLLQPYRARGDFTDCYTTDVNAAVNHAEFVEAFYTTRLFGLERFILKLLIKRPSTHAEARELAEGTRDTFAAWRVETRTDNQILLTDFMGRTRSWLMVQPLSGGAQPQTRLLFGSCIVGPRVASKGHSPADLIFRMLGRFHAPYSEALLASARRRLMHRSG